MAFNSYAFIAFLLLVLGAYNAAPRWLRPAALLAASFIFCAYSSPAHLVWLLAVIAVAYAGGRIVAASPSNLVMACVVALAAMPLLIAKYYDFAARALGQIAGWQVPAADVLLPIGISFYTFRAISYVADVHSGTAAPERRWTRLALYLAFFPPFVAGPIDRPGRILPQLNALSRTTARGLYEGTKLLAWGFFCKLVVADNIAPIVDRIVSAPAQQSGGSLSVALVLYSFQIYFDFLGYTNIAMGVARCFGVHLSRNFRRPYSATSLRDFWRRWHITLSSWFRDYVYVPMGGRATRGAKRAGQVLAVFVLSGLWHGAAVNFLAWGAVHGLAYVIEDTLRRRYGSDEARSRVEYRSFRIAATFAFVTLAWVFFRVAQPEDISIIFQRLFLIDTAVPFTAVNDVLRQRDSIVFVFILGTAVILDASRRARAIRECAPPRTTREVLAELMFINWLVVSLILFGDAGARDFIYFRF